MAKAKKLSKRKLSVLDELFESQLSEQQVLEKYRVSKRLYRKWQGDEPFAEEFESRIAHLHRQSELIIARYAALAAVKLVELLESDKPETSRKACLDIISLRNNIVDKDRQPNDDDICNDIGEVQLSEQKASRLLEVLAELEE